MAALACLLISALLSAGPALARPAVPAELLPHIRVRAGIGGRVLAEGAGASVRPHLSCEFEWRMGPLSRAWWRNKDFEGIDDYPPRTLPDGMEDEK